MAFPQPAFSHPPPPPPPPPPSSQPQHHTHRPSTRSEHLRAISAAAAAATAEQHRPSVPQWVATSGSSGAPGGSSAAAAASQVSAAVARLRIQRAPIPVDFGIRDAAIGYGGGGIGAGGGGGGWQPPQQQHQTWSRRSSTAGGGFGATASSAALAAQDVVIVVDPPKPPPPAPHPLTRPGTAAHRVRQSVTSDLGGGFTGIISKVNSSYDIEKITPGPSKIFEQLQSAVSLLEREYQQSSSALPREDYTSAHRLSLTAPPLMPGRPAGGGGSLFLRRISVGTLDVLKNLA
ncbi:hypothetical protein DFJ73DRAFT_963557, partial [Zopfochytrium polystomum]